jgi:hypothetical protein
MCLASKGILDYNTTAQKLDLRGIGLPAGLCRRLPEYELVMGIGLPAGLSRACPDARRDQEGSEFEAAQCIASKGTLDYNTTVCDMSHFLLNVLS